MASTEYVDIHLLARPKGWEPGDPARAKIEVVAVMAGPDTLKKAVGRERTLKCWKEDRNGNAIQAYPVVKDSATEDGYVVEVKGFAELTTNKEDKPVTYLTAQEARKAPDDVVAQAQASQAASGPSGSSGGSGAPFTEEDRRRSIAQWALKQAAVTVAHAAHPDQPHVDVGDRDAVWDWARWFAASAYSLGALIEAKAPEWGGPPQASPQPAATPSEPAQAPETASQPAPAPAESPPARRDPADDWGVPAEAASWASGGGSVPEGGF